jgi:hypothetical protein
MQFINSLLFKLRWLIYAERKYDKVITLSYFFVFAWLHAKSGHFVYFRVFLVRPAEQKYFKWSLCVLSSFSLAPRGAKIRHRTISHHFKHMCNGGFDLANHFTVCISTICSLFFYLLAFDSICFLCLFIAKVNVTISCSSYISESKSAR